MRDQILQHVWDTPNSVRRTSKKITKRESRVGQSVITCELLAESLQGAADYADAVRIARSMSAPGYTMWTSVYNLTSREARVLYRTGDSEEYRDALDVLQDEGVASP